MRFEPRRKRQRCRSSHVEGDFSRFGSLADLWAANRERLEEVSGVGGRVLWPYSSTLDDFTENLMSESGPYM